MSPNDISSKEIKKKTSHRRSLWVLTEFDPLVGHPYRNVILAVMCLSLIVIVLDNSILNVAIPTISQELGASDKDLLWIIDTYTLVFAGLLLTAGTIGDKYGRRRSLQIGLFIFGTASLFSAFATSPIQLIIGRGIMGIGGAAIMPSTLSIITNIFPAKERGRAIGIWAAFAGIGGAIGPITGGFLISHLHFWWGSIFLINVPIVIIGITANSIIVPESYNKKASKIDIVGAILSIISLSTLLYAIIMGSEEGYTHLNIIIGFSIAIITLTAFFIWESKISHPMLRLSFFKDRRFSSGSISITFIFFALFGITFLLTQYMQLILGYDALKSGAAFIPFALTTFIVSPQSAHLTRRIGTKFTVTIGLTIVLIGLLSMSTLDANNTYKDFAWMFILMAGGMGLVMAPSTSSIMNSLPREKAGVGSAMNDTTRMVGAALGLAIIGSTTANIYRTKIKTDSALHSIRKQYTGTILSEEESNKLFSNISNSMSKAIGHAKALTHPDMIVSPEAREKVEMIPKDIRISVGRTITDAAHQAYLPGLHAGIYVAAVAITLGIISTLIWMPHDALTKEQKEGTA